MTNIVPSRLHVSLISFNLLTTTMKGRQNFRDEKLRNRVYVAYSRSQSNSEKVEISNFDTGELACL